MLKYLSVSSGIIVIMMVIIGFSCSPAKNTTYFQTIPYNSVVQTLITKDFEHRVRPDDILAIEILSTSKEATFYNTSPTGYLVDKNGNIQMFKFGEVKVLGLTTAQVKDRITKMLVPDIFREATVTVRFRNHKIVIMGEVATPGILLMETEHLSILEAIAQKGDLRETSRRDNILVIRDTERGKMFYRVNLLDGSVFNSDYYYLQANDIVYVEQDPDIKKKANNQQIFGYVLSGLSLFFLLLDRITR